MKTGRKYNIADGHELLSNRIMVFIIQIISKKSVFDLVIYFVLLAAKYYHFTLLNWKDQLFCIGLSGFLQFEYLFRASQSDSESAENTPHEPSSADPDDDTLEWKNPPANPFANSAEFETGLSNKDNQNSTR